MNLVFEDSKLFYLAYSIPVFVFFCFLGIELFRKKSSVLLNGFSVFSIILCLTSMILIPFSTSVISTLILSEIFFMGILILFLPCLKRSDLRVFATPAFFSMLLNLLGAAFLYSYYNTFDYQTLQAITRIPSIDFLSCSLFTMAAFIRLTSLYPSSAKVRIFENLPRHFFLAWEGSFCQILLFGFFLIVRSFPASSTFFDITTGLFVFILLIQSLNLAKTMTTSSTILRLSSIIRALLFLNVFYAIKHTQLDLFNTAFLMGSLNLFLISYFMIVTPGHLTKHPSIKSFPAKIHKLVFFFLLVNLMGIPGSPFYRLVSSLIFPLMKSGAILSIIPFIVLLGITTYKSIGVLFQHVMSPPSETVETRHINVNLIYFYFIFSFAIASFALFSDSFLNLFKSI